MDCLFCPVTQCGRLPAGLCNRAGGSFDRDSCMSKKTRKLRGKALILQQGKCYYGGSPIWDSGLSTFAATHAITLRQAALLRCTAEHLKARSDGGSDSVSNVVAACLYCNRSRHSRPSPMSPELYRCHVRSRMARGRWLTFRCDHLGAPGVANPAQISAL